MSTISDAKAGIKPIIKEIVRTQVCFPDIKLVVENVVVVSTGVATSTAKNEAFRLFLTDGELNIQALVRRRMHKAVLELSIRPGSIIVLKEYRLARAKRLNGNGEVAYLAIADFYVTGHREHYALGLGKKFVDKTHQLIEGLRRADRESTSEPQDAGAAKDAQPPQLHQRRDESPMEDSTTDVRHKDQSPELAALPRCHEWIRQASAEHHLRCHLQVEIPASQRCPPVDDADFWQFNKLHPVPEDTPKCPSISHMALAAMMAATPLQPITKPLRIVDLAAITGVNKSRNQTVDVLAVIESIDDFTIKPARLPLKRDILIRDPSVSEPVTLSVFVDPVGFRCSRGTVALLRNVTTHDYRRGNVNAYPVHCEGREWFVPDPRCVDLGGRKLDDLESWWAEQQSLEQV